MMATETISTTMPERYAAQLALKGFNVYYLSKVINKTYKFTKRNFYKIVLIKGPVTVNYDGRL